MKTNNEEYIKSVGRALKILKSFEDNNKKTFTEIRKECNLPKATASRMLSTLIDEGFLVKRDNSIYELGTILLRLGHTVEKNNDLISISEPIMRQLSQETNETICLNTIIEDKRVCISKIEGNETLRQFIEVGRSTPMHRGGSGKLLLAFTEEDKRERIISNIEDEEKDFIIKLKKELEEVRKEGVASSRGERILGAASISAPIFDKNGNLLGGIAISSASIRINDETENKYKQLIIEKAKEISRLMGYKS